MEPGQRHRPRIGISGRRFHSKEGNWLRDGQIASTGESIWSAHGLPFILPAHVGLSHNELYAEIQDMFKGLDGLLIAGEGDVDLLDISLPWEIALVRIAILEEKIPVLGIGRGMQVINVALSTTTLSAEAYKPQAAIISIDLYLAQLSFRPSFRHGGYADGIYAGAHSFHPVQVIAGSLLAACLETSYLGRVSSLHTHTIGQLAPGLEVCALAPDGVIEGIALQGEGETLFCMGVQFFPPSADLFTAFLGACSRRADRMSRVVPVPQGESSALVSAETTG